MAILIMNIMTGEPNEWRAAIQAELPDLDVRFMPDAGDTSDIRYLAFGKPDFDALPELCLLYTSPSPRDATLSRMPSSA